MKKTAKDKKPWKERRLYVFKCGRCERPKARSHKRSRARLQLCRRCRKGVDENPNQLSILGAVKNTGDVPEYAPPDGAAAHVIMKADGTPLLSGDVPVGAEVKVTLTKGAAYGSVSAPKGRRKNGKTKANPSSSCCGAQCETNTADEGTSFCWCTSCGKPCDPVYV